MGGQSFKCPKCDEWFLSKPALGAHLSDRHLEPAGFTVEGSGPLARVVPVGAHKLARISWRALKRYADF